MVTLTVIGTAAIVKKWFKMKRSEMCIATFRKAKDKTDEQPLKSDVAYWNGDSVFSEFSYFEPLKSTEAIEMCYMDGSKVYV